MPSQRQPTPPPGSDPFAVDAPAKEQVTTIIAMARLLLEHSHGVLPGNNIQQFTVSLDGAERVVMAYFTQRAAVTLTMAERVHAANRRAELAEDELVGARETIAAHEKRLEEFETYANQTEPLIRRLEAENEQLRECSTTLPVGANEELASLKAELEIANAEILALRKQVEEAQLAQRAAESRNRRETSVLGSRVPVQELERAKTETAKALNDKATVEEANVLLRRERDELNTRLLATQAGVDAAQDVLQERVRERDAAREEAIRFKKERDKASIEMQQAKAEAQRCADLAAADRAKLAALQSATRVGKAGMPLIVLAKPQDFNKGQGKTPDQLMELFPAPHFAKYFLQAAQLLEMVLARKMSLPDLMTNLGTFRQAELDRFYDRQLPVVELIRTVNHDGLLWFSDLHQHLAISNAQLQRIHAQLGPLRDERIKLLEQAEAMQRALNDERSGNRQIIISLRARVRTMESALDEIERALV